MKRKLQFLVALFAALPWWTAHATEPLGRLFFTPAQRSALDAGKQIGAPRSSRAPAARGPREVTLNGIVTRSDGASTVWVNGRALDGQPGSGVSATASGSDPAAARVKVGGARNTVGMRVGQHLQPATGKIAESYEARVARDVTGTRAPPGKSAAADKQTPSVTDAPPGRPSEN